MTAGPVTEPVIYTCTKCGCSHDGEPMRSQLEKRSKDTSKIAFCVVCFVDVLEHLCDCRMCGEVPDERSACPECGACWECASDDCGICVDRIAYKIAETPKIATRKEPA